MFISKLFQSLSGRDPDATELCLATATHKPSPVPHPSGPLTLPPGYTLQEYRIEKVLGVGGFGITYQALDDLLDERVAIKEYMPSNLAHRVDGVTVSVKAEDAQDTFHLAMDCFFNEAKMLAKIRNYNIVRVRRLFKENNTAYLVMDFEEGEALKALLVANLDTPMEESWLMGLIVPLLEGLEWIHSNHIVHRDIKPANIFMRQDGSPLLIDFGAAKHLAGHQGGANFVSHGYSPIEQYDYGAIQGPWTDIYAMGATLYEVVTGGKPVSALDRQQAVASGLSDPLLPLIPAKGHVLSPRMNQFIEAALRLEGDQRPQSIPDWRGILLGPSYAPGKMFAGQKKSCKLVDPLLKCLKIGLGWDMGEFQGSPVDLDAAVLLLGRNGKVRSDDDFIFFNNLTSPCGSVRHLGDNADGSGQGDDETLLVNLDTLPPEITTLVFAVSLNDPENRGIHFQHVQNATIRVTNADTDNELFFYNLSREYAEENAVIIGELYRHHDQWIFGVETCGFAGGLAELIAHYGVEVAD